jgi:hypothetical protein
MEPGLAMPLSAEGWRCLWVAEVALRPRVQVVEKEGRMAEQEQTKVSQHSLFSKQRAKEAAGADPVPS